MTVSKSVTPSATYSCQGRLPYVSAFPLKRLSGRQRDREHGSGRLCLHTLEVTCIYSVLLLTRLCHFGNIQVLQCQLLSLSVRHVLPVRS